MFWGLGKMVGARRLARPRLPDSESGGSAIPREPRADEIGIPDRLRSGDLLHERQACWTGLHYRDKHGEGRRICASDLMHVTHPLWLAELCPRKWWGIAPTTGRTCSRFQVGVLVYAGLFPMLAEGARFALAMGEPHLLSGQAPRLSGLPPQQFKMVGVPGNAPGLGTDLVRFRL
jgi:hypothetical protein